MAVKQTKVNEWYSTLTDNFYDSEMAARHYDNLELRRSTPESEGSKLLDAMSAAQIKALVTEMNIRVDQPGRNQDWKRVQQDFVDANPDYLGNDVNGNLMCLELYHRKLISDDGSTFLGTMDDVQAAYVDLATKGILQMRPGARRPKTAEQDAEELPMGELLDRARGW